VPYLVADEENRVRKFKLGLNESLIRSYVSKS
jgi:hypothetical protein